MPAQWLAAAAVTTCWQFATARLAGSAALCKMAGWQDMAHHAAQAGRASAVSRCGRRRSAGCWGSGRPCKRVTPCHAIHAAMCRNETEEKSNEPTGEKIRAIPAQCKRWISVVHALNVKSGWLSASVPRNKCSVSKKSVGVAKHDAIANQACAATCGRNQCAHEQQWAALQPPVERQSRSQSLFRTNKAHSSATACSQALRASGAGGVGPRYSCHSACPRARDTRRPGCWAE